MILSSCGGKPVTSADPRAPNQARRPSRGTRSRRHFDGRRAVGCRIARSDRVRGSRLGQPRRAGHHRHLLRLPVPVLLARRATIDQVKTTYGPDKVRIVWKNEPLPFHPNARPAAEAAEGVFALAGNDAFWKFHATAFKNQQALRPRELREVGQRKRASRTRRSSRQGLDAHTWAEKVDKDLAARQEVGANGTPHFSINGVALSRRAAVRQVQGGHRRRARQGRKRRSRAARRPEQDLRRRCRRRTRRPLQPSPSKKTEAAPEEEDKTRLEGARRRARRSTGPDNALVTIVEFSDFQCPFCKRVEDTLKKVHETYGDKVRLVWKHEPLPFHPRAEPAAELAMMRLQGEGQQGLLGRARQAVRSSAEARGRDSRGRRQGPRPRRGEGEGGDEHAQVQGAHRRRRRPRRRRQGQRHAALLHQRPPPRRRAAVREVQGDHRRGDQERPGAARQGHRAQGRLRRDHEGRQRSRRRPRRRRSPRRPARTRSRAARTRRSSSRSSATSSARSAGASSRR